MIIKYLRRKFDGDYVNLKALSKSVYDLKRVASGEVKNHLSFKENYEDVKATVNKIANDIKSIAQFDEKVGVLVGFVDDGKLFIGYSKCNMDYEDFDREFGLDVATDRAVTFDERYNEDYPANIPNAVKKELPEFVNRCLRYYKDAKLTSWVKAYLGDIE